MADLPIWRVVEAIRDIQRLRLESPDTVPPEIDALAETVSAGLAAHIASMRAAVENALAVAPDDDVQRCLDGAVERLETVRSSIEESIRRLQEDSDREAACQYLESTLETNFSGAAMRTRENPFQLFDRPAVSRRAAVRPHDDERRVETVRTFENLHPNVVAKAEALGHDPRRIYDFVATEIRFALYAGHFRAPFEVLADRVGNDADLAGLLIELLRASGIDARLVSGTMRLTERAAAEWLDLHDFATIEKCLRDSGYTIYVSSTSEPRTFDVIDHYRVRALLDLGEGPQWFDLDPGVRAQEIAHPGRRAWTAEPWSDALETEFFSDPAQFGPLAFYEKRLRAALDTIDLKSQLRTRRRVADAEFPPALPYEPVGFAQERSWFEPRDEWAIGLQLVQAGVGTILEHRFSTPGSCRDRIILRYAPATATAAALLSSPAGPLAAPSFAVDLRPRLEIHRPSGETSFVEGTGRVAWGTSLYMAISFEHPGLMMGQSSSEARPLAGTEWEFALEGPGALFTAPEPDNPFVPLVETARSMSDFVQPLLHAYHLRVADAASRVAALADAVGTSGPMLTIGAAAFETISIGGIAVRQRPSSVLIDVRSLELHLYDSEGASLAPFVELILAEGSHQEAQVLRDHLGVRAMSTIAALRAATRQSNPIRVIRQDERDAIDELEHPARVKHALSVALGISGRENVTVTQRPVDFGARKVSAWIERGGPAPASDFAIGSLNGGIGHDDDPKPRKPTVIVFPEEAIETAGHYVTFGAIAWDEERLEILDRYIEWSITPWVPGAGFENSAKYYPERTGTYTVTASVNLDKLPSLEHARTVSDDCQTSIWEAEIKKLVFEESPELKSIRKGDDLGKVHYAPGQDPSPAVLAAGKRTMARMTLKVTPVSSTKALTLIIEGIGKDGDQEILKFSKEIPLQGSFEGDVFLDVPVENILGIVTTIDWTFRVLWTSCEIKTDVRIFIVADRPPEKPKWHRNWVEIFDWACEWTRGMVPTDRVAVLNRLFDRRASAKVGDKYVMFSYRPGDLNGGLDGIVKGGIGQCPDFAEWFLALGEVHGIEGTRLSIFLQLEQKTKKMKRWRSIFSAARGLNNPKFDGTVHFRDFYLLPAGTYVSDADLELDKMLPSTQLDGTLWQFQHHVVSLFTVDGKEYFYDASMDPGDHFEWTLGTGKRDLSSDHEFRTGYFKNAAKYLSLDYDFGDPKGNGTGGEEQVLVDNEEMRRSGEWLRLLFSYEVP